MIASHNTFTYLKTKDWKVNKLSNFWRYQNLTIKQQYRAGVRYFDIRVFRDNDKWRICSGKINFDKTFSNLRQIDTYISNNFLKSVFRLILEKGDSTKFKEEVSELIKKLKCLMSVSIKATGEQLYYRKNHPTLINYSKLKFSMLDLFIGIFINPKKFYSKLYKITLEMIDNKKHIYLMDFVK